MNDAKKQRKIIKWERQEIATNLDIPRDACKDGHDKRPKWYRPNRSTRY